MKRAFALVIVALLASFGLRAQDSGTKGAPSVPMAVEQWMRAAWGVDPTSLGYTDTHFLLSLTESEREGAFLFKQRCNFCHYSMAATMFGGQDGLMSTLSLGPFLTKTHVEGREETVRRKILDGSQTMPAFKHGLSPMQIDQIISYLKKVEGETTTSFLKRRLTRSERPETTSGAVDAPRPMVPASASAQATADRQGGPALFGTVTSSSGAKMAGVTVSAHAVGRNVKVSVFTDDQGDYYFPPMEAGRYKVWAQDQASEAGRGEVTLSSSAVRQHFTLKPLKDFEQQLSGDVWYAALPETTREEKRMKEVFRLACMGCHSINYTFATKYDANGWKTIIDAMSRTGGYAYGDPAEAAKRKPNPIMVRFRDSLAAYLAQVRGPGSALLTFAPRRATGDVQLAVIREYDVPEPGFGLPLYNDGSDWSKGAPDFMDEAHHHTMNATVDHDGNLWVADTFNLTFTVAKIDWKTGQATKFSTYGAPAGLPQNRARGDVAEGGRAQVSGAPANSHDIITDQHGIIWFDMSSIGALGRVDPQVAKIEVIRPPGTDKVGAFVYEDGTGAIWTSAEIGGVPSPGDIRSLRYDPKTKQWDARVANPIHNMATYGMAGDRDGNGWYSVQHPTDAMVKADYKTGKATVLPLPRPTNDRSELFTREELQMFETVRLGFSGSGKPGVQAVRKPAADRNRDVVWGPGWFGSLVKIDTHTQKMTTYPFPHGDSNVNAYEASIDHEGNVWVMFSLADSIGKFDPKSEKWTTYPLPTLGIKSHGLQAITVNGRTQIGMGYLGVGKVAKLEFRTREEVQSLKAQVRR